MQRVLERIANSSDDPYERWIIAMAKVVAEDEHSASKRDEVLAIRREIYDGRLTRPLGSAGGRGFKWTGKPGCVAAVTGAVRKANDTRGSRWGRVSICGMRIARNRGHRPEAARVVFAALSDCEWVRSEPSPSPSD
jgi:hypothetical protein